ncbi:aromatic ring-hydroxylating dioxygenase subunit alpha [Myxococcota bacterium]|nr:aromatic ring-hydroxylating dioxygenase subunit alpha [Myxococcota bacterium]
MATPTQQPDITRIPERWRLGKDFVPKGRYIDPEFLALEYEQLFPRTWQMACREQQLGAVGSVVEYTIGDQSIAVVRTQEDEVKAFHNACRHRGVRLVRGDSRIREFHCPFHGWRYALDGTCTFQHLENEFEPRDADYRNLRPVRCERWGGFVFINLDPDAVPLLEALDPLPEALAPFRLEDMRLLWHKQTILPANWKSAIDAFIEGYHTPGTHPQYMRLAESNTPSARPAELPLYKYAPYTPSIRYEGHSRFVFGVREDGEREQIRSSAPGADLVANQVQYQVQELRALNTQRDGRAAAALRERTFERGERPDVVFQQLRRELAEAEGVEWPEMTREQLQAGIGDWHVFPTLVILVEVGCMLGYRSRPNGNDPDSCIFDVYSFEHFPPDGAPTVQTEWIPDWRSHLGWGQVLTQDFRNMSEVTAGLHSHGFDGHWLNVEQEMAVHNAHHIADRYLFEA